MVEGDLESGEVGEVRVPHRGDHRPLVPALGSRPDHDRRAVRVVGAEIDRTMPPQPLEPRKNVGLDVLDEMAEVDVAVGVGERRGDENASRAIVHGW